MSTVDSFALLQEDLIEEIIARGFTFPLLFCALGLNGAVLVFRMTLEDEDPEILANNGMDFRFPVTNLVVDGAGQTASCTLDRSGGRTWH